MKTFTIDKPPTTSARSHPEEARPLRLQPPIRRPFATSETGKLAAEWPTEPAGAIWNSPAWRTPGGERIQEREGALRAISGSASKAGRARKPKAERNVKVSRGHTRKVAPREAKRARKPIPPKPPKARKRGPPCAAVARERQQDRKPSRAFWNGKGGADAGKIMKVTPGSAQVRGSSSALIGTRWGRTSSPRSREDGERLYISRVSPRLLAPPPAARPWRAFPACVPDSGRIKRNSATNLPKARNTALVVRMPGPNRRFDVSAISCGSRKTILRLLPPFLAIFVDRPGPSARNGLLVGLMPPDDDHVDILRMQAPIQADALCIPPRQGWPRPRTARTPSSATLGVVQDRAP